METQERWTKFPWYSSSNFRSDPFLLFVIFAAGLTALQYLTAQEFTVWSQAVGAAELAAIAYVFSKRSVAYQFISGKYPAYRVYYDALSWGVSTDGAYADSGKWFLSMAANALRMTNAKLKKWA